MTPEKSADAALEWLRYKAIERKKGVPTWLGLEQGLKNYNMNRQFHDDTKNDPKRMWRDDYHPGMKHYDWYATAIMLRTADLLKRNREAQ